MVLLPLIYRVRKRLVAHGSSRDVVRRRDSKEEYEQKEEDSNEVQKTVTETSNNVREH
jgi:hypothetical protein